MTIVVEPHTQHIISEASIQKLPPPVARSLRRSGAVGQPVPNRVRLSQRGQILLSDRWLPFTADETYTLDPPSFDWAASVRLAGLPIARAKDSLADGRGRMQVRLANLFTVVDASGPEMDQGSLLRWLNETMWFPHVWATDVISWRPVDDTSAIGAVSVDDLTVEAEFRFDTEGRLVDFCAERYRVGEGEAALTTWCTPLTGHARFDGVEVPVEGSAIWELEAGDLEYIRLQVTDLRLE
jgi:hypothetical protein